MAKSPYPGAGEYWTWAGDLGRTKRRAVYASLGSEDLYPAGSIGTFRGFLREGDLVSYVLGKIALWQCRGCGVEGRGRAWTQEDHLGSWQKIQAVDEKELDWGTRQGLSGRWLEA